MDENNELPVEETEPEAEEKSETSGPEEESPEAKIARLSRENKQLRKKLNKSELKEQPIVDQKPTDLDYGQKAFLKASGINGTDEIALVKEHQKISGESLDNLIENPYFKQKLEALRVTKANLDAAEGGNNRGGGTSRTSVEYWLSRGEHPPKELGKKLAEEYVEARRKQNSTNKMFFDD